METNNAMTENKIIPPLKIGDTVYQIDYVRVYESKIISIFTHPNGKAEYNTKGIAFNEDAIIIHSVFLTREEAEEALNKKWMN